MRRIGGFDVLIIGGGVIGLATARALRRRGVSRIAVVDRGTVGREASHAAAGMLLPHVETESDDAFFRMCLRASLLYGELASELLDETGIDIELTREGTLHVAFTTNAAAMDKRFEWQRRAGLAVERLSSREISLLEPSLSREVSAGLFYPHDQSVENRKLISALVRFCKNNDVRLIEDVAIADLSQQNGRHWTASGENLVIDAERVLLAAGAWTSAIKLNGRKLSFSVSPVKGQIFCFVGGSGLLGRTVFGPGAYLVPRRDGRILVGATVENKGFDKSVAATAIETLHTAGLEMIPALANLKIAEAWAGLRPMSPDALPFLGSVPDASGVYVATAHYRNGILLAPFTADVMAAALCGEPVPAELAAFSPTRTLTAASG